MHQRCQFWKTTFVTRVFFAHFFISFTAKLAENLLMLIFIEIIYAFIINQRNDMSKIYFFSFLFYPLKREKYFSFNFCFSFLDSWYSWFSKFFLGLGAIVVPHFLYCPLFFLLNTSPIFHQCLKIYLHYSLFLQNNFHSD